jgi:hypothetical protein
MNHQSPFEDSSLSDFLQMKPENHNTFVRIMLIILLIAVCCSCNTINNTPTIGDIAESNRNKNTPVSQIDLIAYDYFGYYWPVTEVPEGTVSPIPLESIELISSPFGALRGAINTLDSTRYDAWEFQMDYQGVEYESVLILDERGPGPKRIYAIEATSDIIGYTLPINPDSWVIGPDPSVSHIVCYFQPIGQLPSFDLRSPENQHLVGGLIWSVEWILEDGTPETIIIQQESGTDSFGYIDIAASTADIGDLGPQPCIWTTMEITVIPINPSANIAGTRICSQVRQGEFPPQQPSCESVSCDYAGEFQIIYP